MKYLWQDLDKISLLLKKNCPKILLLDFDGTLTPIVDSPEKAKPSQETKKLLQKLSQKSNFYLAIISGRQLKDIKERINLPNIIYGGNHGLEGEFFEKKFIHQTAKNTVQIIKEVRKKLEQLSKKYKGVLIEDKRFALGFHYRMVDKNKVKEIRALFKNLIKSFLKSNLLSVISGKKEIDILPKTEWSKGHFADLITNEIADRTKTHPVIIVIGDDKTDENAFQNMKKEITIVVGNKSNSKAKYYLENTDEVAEFLSYLTSFDSRDTKHSSNLNRNYFTEIAALNNIITKKKFHNPKFLQFWRGLIRDSSGRWNIYHLKGVKYFRYGRQTKPDLMDRLQLSLIQSSIRHERAFLNGLYNGSFSNLKPWLIQLHHKQSYFGIKGQILSRRRISQGEHTQIVAKSIPTLAKKYDDPYITEGTQVVRLPGINSENCPKDRWKNNRLFHYYPDPKYFDQYLRIMKKQLEQFIFQANGKANKETIRIIANYYQYGINIHMFESVNQSLFANQANAMLKLLGLKPIEHGIIDFVAMRLQPKNFADYFFDEVRKFQV